jgi:excisionase family DNA binding protein
MNRRNPMNAACTRGLITRAEACRRLAIGPETLERLVRDGRLSIRQIPGALPRLVAAEIEALIAAFTTQATS